MAIRQYATAILLGTSIASNALTGAFFIGVALEFCLFWLLTGQVEHARQGFVCVAIALLVALPALLIELHSPHGQALEFFWFDLSSHASEYILPYACLFGAGALGQALWKD